MTGSRPAFAVNVGNVNKGKLQGSKNEKKYLSICTYAPIAYFWNADDGGRKIR